MSKPTIFFSHSSKDKECIFPLRDKLESITGKAIDIFMSSDGQSIPFGTNWVHKIEQSLADAKIMFVFVTENSIKSGWIYFESGFAYSKGIKVVPIGVGIDVGSLKPPLNLLQGFNLVSEDSLNNIISIVNREFDYTFKAEFDNDDFNGIMGYLSNGHKGKDLFNDIIQNAECSFENYSNIDIKYDFSTIWESIICYLQSEKKDYSLKNRLSTEHIDCAVVEGVKIQYKHNFDEQLTIAISKYSFIQSFDTFCKIIKLFNNNTNQYLRLHLNDKYKLVQNAEDLGHVHIMV